MLGVGSRSIRSSSGWSKSVHRTGHGIEVDTAQIDCPQQVSLVGYDQLLGGAAAGEADSRCLNPGWPFGRSAFLEEGFALYAVREAVQDVWTV